MATAIEVPRDVWDLIIDNQMAQIVFTDGVDGNRQWRQHLSRGRTVLHQSAKQLAQAYPAYSEQEWRDIMVAAAERVYTLVGSDLPEGLYLQTTV